MELLSEAGAEAVEV
jgi:ribonuclease HI